MADYQEQITRYLDLSGGLQTKTSRLLMKDNELERAENGRYDKKLGGVTRRMGYEGITTELINGSSRRVGGINSFCRGDEKTNLLVDITDSTSTQTDKYYLDGSSFASGSASIPVADAKVNYVNFLNCAYYVGSTDTYRGFIKRRNTAGTETTLNTDYNYLQGKYLAKYNSKLYLANCQIGNKKYPNRIYVSSAPTDAITYVNGDYKGSIWQMTVDSTRYLKAGMVVDIYGESSNVKKVDSLAIVSVDKGTETITFAKTTIDITDRDEIYIQDTKGEQDVYWNTDYPNPESSDWLEIPAEDNEPPVITALFVNNNRLHIFTEHTRWKWDGANLVKVSSTIGTTAQYSVKEVKGHMVFCNKLGIWAVHDANGTEQLISRGIQDYIDAVSHTGWKDAVAMVKGDVYRLYVGVLGQINSRTTSTSTSSTSTSSTSSSTSSTSTSSTSTSSTSSSTSRSTTSTSSTSRSTSSTSSSISTSSTSTSSTSSSTSTSSTSSSTSTTTLAESTERTIFTYDFSINAFSVDKIDRDITCATNHIMHGYEKTYFGTSDGRVYRDETTLTDWKRPIQLLVETKRFHQDLPEETKTYRYAYIYTQNGQNAFASYSIDGGEWQVIGQLAKNVTRVDLRDVKGRDIAFRVTQNNGGESVVFIGVSVVWLKGERYAASS